MQPKNPNTQSHLHLVQPEDLNPDLGGNSPVMTLTAPEDQQSAPDIDPQTGTVALVEPVVAEIVEPTVENQVTNKKPWIDRKAEKWQQDRQDKETNRAAKAQRKADRSAANGARSKLSSLEIKVHDPDLSDEERTELGVQIAEIKSQIATEKEQRTQNSRVRKFGRSIIRRSNSQTANASDVVSDDTTVNAVVTDAQVPKRPWIDRKAEKWQQKRLAREAAQATQNDTEAVTDGSVPKKARIDRYAQKLQQKRLAKEGRAADNGDNGENQDTAQNEADKEAEQDPEALFNNLDSTRQRFLRLGAKAEFNPLRTGVAYRKAEKAYREAFVKFQAALLEDEAFENYSDDQLKGMAAEGVINELHAVETWKYDIQTKMKESRTGRFLSWYGRQNLATKVLLGGAVGMASTVGLAGLAGGAGLLAATAAAKSAQSLASRNATKLARQQSAGVTEEDEQQLEESFYAKDDTLEGAESAFNHITGQESARARKARWAGRGALALTAGAVVGGRFLGEAMNRRFTHTSRGANKPAVTHTNKQDVVTALGGGKNTTSHLVNNGAGTHSNLAGNILGGSSASPAGQAEVVAQIRPGSGLLENLHAAGLNAQQAQAALDKFDKEGLLDGKHIGGVIKRGGRVVMYLRGQGDGSVHYTGRAAEIINSFKQSA